MLEIKNITKKFGAVTACNDISFKIAPGEIVGFLGPNGSGKTTLLRIISTFFEPTTGTAIINNFDILKNPFEIRKIIGYLPESNILYQHMVVKDFLIFVGKARGLFGDLLNDRLKWCVDVLKIQDVMKKRCIECSKGYKQRIAMASAIIHDPEIILLDEPTSGLDPIQIMAFRDFIISLKQDKIIILSTHILQEVASIANRVLIIYDGILREDVLFNELDNKTEKLEKIFTNSISKSILESSKN